MTPTDYPQTSRRQYFILGLTLCLSLLVGWLLAQSVQAQNLTTSADTTEESAYVLGEPCGSGELLPEWTICLHGSVSLIEETPSLLSDIPLTVTYGSHIVTGTTFVHPGYTTPTYGIDISSLEPEFLKPVTLTAEVSGTQITRRVIVYPDFRTQSQRLDLRIPTVGALDPAPVWGSVFALSARGAVTGATVTATANNHTIVVTTTSLSSSYEQPIYRLSQSDLDSLGVGTGNLLTLTAAYDNDNDRRVIELKPAPQQVNFVTGWKCDGFDPLPRTSGGEGMPRTSGGEGMPRTSGGEGMPNIACFWGYGVVDNKAQAGMLINLTVSGTHYSDVTQLYPNEEQPRYAIGLWGGELINGEKISVTGVFSGDSNTQVLTATLDHALSQRIDLFLRSATSLSTGPYGGEVKSIIYTNDFNHSTEQGAAWVLMSDGQNNIYRRPAGESTWQLASEDWEGYEFQAIGISPDCSELTKTGSIWASIQDRDDTNRHYIARRPCAGSNWQVVYDAQDIWAREILFSSDYDESQGLGQLSIVGSHLYEYDLSSNSWRIISIPSGYQIWGSAVSPNYSLESNTGAIYIAMDPSSPYEAVPIYRLPAGGSGSEWESVPNAGLPTPHTLQRLIFDENGGLWAALTAGVYKLPIGSSIWEFQGDFPHAGSHQYATDLAFSPDFDENLKTGFIVASSKYGVYRQTADSATWSLLQSPIPLLTDKTEATTVRVSPNYDVGKGVLLAGFDGAMRSGVFEYGPEGWTETNKGLSNLTIVQIDTTKDYNARLGGGTIWSLSEADGLFVSRDNGNTWMPTGEVYTTASGTLSPLRLQSFRISPDFDEQAGIGSIWAVRPNASDNIIRLPAGDKDWVTTGDSPFPGDTNIGLTFTPDYSEIYSQGDIWLWSTSDPAAPPYRRTGPTGTWISVTTGLPLEPRIKSISVSPDYNDTQDLGSVWASTEEGIYRLDVNGDAWVKQTTISVHDLVFSANYNEENASGAVLGIRSYNHREVYQCLPDNFGEWQRVGGTFPTSMPTIKAISVSPDYDGASQGNIWAALSYEGIYHLSPEQGTWGQIFRGNISDIILSPAFEHDRTLILASDQGVLEYVPPAIDLDLHIVGQEEIAPGSLTTVTFQYANLGTKEAKTSILSTNLPDDMAFVTSNLSPIQTNPPAWALGAVVSEMRGLITASFRISPYVQFGKHLTITAQIQSTSPEPYKNNNASSTAFKVINPSRVDVGVSLSGPPILTPGTPAIYNAWMNNAYGKTVSTVTITLYLPHGLELHSAIPQPISLSPAIWHTGPLAAGISQPIILTTTVAPTLPLDSKVAVTASITTTASDENPLNNTATITTSTTLTDAQSLILVAPERLTDQYGASPLLSKLHQLAAHPRVQGAVVDVLTNRDVRATYASWDADPSSAAKANEVAMAIKAIIDDYTLTYPNLRYLVLVGNDAMLPFYRVRDQNATHWHERKYCPHTPVGTVRSALCADYFLTDDFYADRAPTTPNSPFWKDEHPLYLPDFAIGRLLETPEEMIAAIDTFLSSGGEIPLNPALIGTHSHLVNDLGSLQCKALQDAGLTTTCTTGPNQFRTHVRQGTWGSLWAAFHSNHQKLGTLSAFSLKESNPGDGIAILASIGCHSGTSVNDGDALHLSYDLPQAGQHRGWPVIAPTAYAYASYLDVEYSEALMQELTQQLLRNDTQTLGLSMIRAKQAYYADRAWFDYTDEKVLLPMTLYGLPMTHVTLPSYVQTYTEEEVPLVESRELQYLTVVTHTVSGVTFTTQTTEDGTYYAYQDQMIAQEGHPIQPATDIPLPATIQDRTLRGIRLQSATYADETPFDPVIAQSWAIGEPQSRLAAEPPLALTGWDRSLPHQLGHFQGLYENENRAALNLTLGAFHAKTETERQFTDLEIVALYGEGTDYVPPTIIEVSGFRADVKRRFHAKVEDNEGLWQVTVLCDDGNNTLTSVPMRESSSPRLWVGQTPDYVTRYYLQAVDINGNITRTDWRPLTTGHSLYLPLILR